MTNLPAIATIDHEIAERSADPAEFVMAACERAKAWLAEILADGSIEQIVEMKSQAEAIRVYTVQKNLGKDAELAAQEIVRRAERGIGLAIRRGQEAGEIESRDESRVRAGLAVHGLDSGAIKPRPLDFFAHPSERADAYTVTDGVSDDQFEQVISEAKDEGNLSRANVVRKVKGHTPIDQRGEYHRGRRHIDHYRVLGETVSALEGLETGIRLLDVESIPEAERGEWGAQLREALRPLNKFAREISS